MKGGYELISWMFDLQYKMFLLNYTHKEKSINKNMDLQYKMFLLNRTK